jgi:hypothetical protein
MIRNHRVCNDVKLSNTALHLWEIVATLTQEGIANRSVNRQ